MVNRIGESITPCLTPFDSFNHREKWLRPENKRHFRTQNLELKTQNFI